jgi:hypothetical protein
MVIGGRTLIWCTVSIFARKNCGYRVKTAESLVGISVNFDADVRTQVSFTPSASLGSLSEL